MSVSFSLCSFSVPLSPAISVRCFPRPVHHQTARSQSCQAFSTLFDPGLHRTPLRSRTFVNVSFYARL
jgi:hypothetical protein